jgi:hypothetical protein
MKKTKTLFKHLEVGDQFYFSYELGIVKLYKTEHIVDDNLRTLGTFEKTDDKFYKLVGLVNIYTDRKSKKVPNHRGICIPNTEIVLA